MNYIYEHLKKFLKSIVQGCQVLIDPVFLLALCAGFIVWFKSPPSNPIPWDKLLVFSFVEEFVFRFSIQETLNKAFREKMIIWRIGAANLLTSVIFVLLHLFINSWPWAGLVLFPSLVFGLVWDRYRNLIPCWCLHFSYNIIYFYRY